MNKIIITSLLLTISGLAQASTDDSYYANIVYKDIAFDWSIDNSHVEGHLNKESEIIWNAKIPVIELGKSTSWSNHRFYLGQTQSGDMTDEDWRMDELGGSEKWSSTSSSIDYFQVGYDYRASLLRFREIPVFDKIDLLAHSGLMYEDWDAYGLIDKLNGGYEQYDSSTLVISNKSLWLRSSLGVAFEKQIGKFNFKLLQQAGINTVYNVDTHHLRDDLESDSFVIFGAYGMYSAEAIASYDITQSSKINIGYRYEYARNISDKISVNYESGHGEDGKTIINTSSRKESAIYIGLEHSF